MSNEERSIVERVHDLRAGAHRLKTNIKNWDFRFDYKLTRYESEAVLNLIEFFDQMDDISDVVDMIRTYEEVHKYD